VEYGKECWAGNSVGTSSTSTNCNMKCSGDSAFTCGGGYALNAYNIKNVAQGGLSSKDLANFDNSTPPQTPTSHAAPQYSVSLLSVSIVFVTVFNMLVKFF